MSEGFDLPLSILATSVVFRPDGTATLSGVWYSKSPHLPASREERMGITADLAAHKCVLVELVGTQRQVAELIMLAAAAENEEDSGEAIARVRALLEELTEGRNKRHDFDNVHNPQGTSFPIDFPVRVDTDFLSLKKILFSNPDLIRLQVQPGWSLWSGIQPPQ
jgi:hypothetical protein